MVAYSEAFNQAHYSDRQWIGMIGFSIVLHALFFCGIIFLPELGRTTRHMPVAVEVDLVSLPLAGPQGPSPSAEKAGAPPVETETAPAEPVKVAEPKKAPEPPKAVVEAPPTQETVSLAPKPLEVKKSLKKKTYDASKVISKAIARIEKEAPESRPRSVVQAIDQMKKEVQAAPGRPGGGGGPVGARAGGGTGGGSAAVGTGTGGKGLGILDVYSTAIWQDHIEKNWVLPEFLQEQRGLEAIVSVRIMRNGEIRNISLEKTSGNRQFDDSALRAIKKSDPLPPLPKTFPDPFLEVGFRFNPSLLRRSP